MDPTIASNNAPAGAAGTPRAGRPALDSDFETFLKMLTTQMRNQDPLNPMEASDFAVQLATFSSVEQQVRTNTLLEGMAARSGVAELAALVGMEARAAVPAYFSGEPLEIAVPSHPQADRAELAIRNAMGTVVKAVQVDPAQGSFTWTGLGEDGMPMPTGLYSAEVLHFRADEPLASGTGEIYARVIEAQQGAAGAVVVLPGGIELPASEILGLRVGPK